MQLWKALNDQLVKFIQQITIKDIMTVFVHTHYVQNASGSAHPKTLATKITRGLSCFIILQRYLLSSERAWSEQAYCSSFLICALRSKKLIFRVEEHCGCLQLHAHVVFCKLIWHCVTNTVFVKYLKDRLQG